MNGTISKEMRYLMEYYPEKVREALMKFHSSDPVVIEVPGLRYEIFTSTNKHRHNPIPEFLK